MSNAPGMPVVVEDESTDVVIGDDGKPQVDLNVTFREDDINKFRAGYKCLRCWEELEAAWPNKCPACGYRVKDFQSHDFSRQYGGEKWVGPSTSMREEIDRLDEEDEKRAWERHPTSGIIVPRGYPEGGRI